MGDLDLPPRYRFQQIAMHYKRQLIPMMKIWKKEIESKLGEDGIAQVLDSLFWPKENMEEMDGIVEAIAHPAVTHNLIVTWNAMYELNHPTFCTGVLMTQMDGTVIHGRN